jgi:hypothetical protein
MLPYLLAAAKGGDTAILDLLMAVAIDESGICYSFVTMRDGNGRAARLCLDQNDQNPIRNEIPNPQA